MNTFRINFVRILCLGLVIFLVSQFFKEPTPGLSREQDLFYGILVWGGLGVFVLGLWVHAESKHSEFKKEEKAENLRLLNELYESSGKDWSKSDRDSSWYKTLMIIAAIATIIGVLLQLLK